MSDAESPLGAMVDTGVADTPEFAPDTAPQTDVGTDVPAEQQPTGTEQLGQREPGEPQEQQKPAPNFGRDVARMIRELSDTNPDKAALLRQIKEAVFRDISYKGHFDTPEAAQRAKATFEAIGGEEGLTRLQDSADAVRQIDEQAAAGAPELIDAWAQESPEGLVKAAPYALSKIEQMNPQAYNKMMVPHFVKALWATGINDVVRNLEWYANQLGNTGLTNEVAGMRQWLSQLQQVSEQYNQQASDPRASEFAKQRQDLAQQQAQFKEQQIRMAVQPDIETAVETSLKQFDRQGIFKGQARLDMLNAIVNEIDRTLMNDRVYQSNLTALKQKGEIEAISKYIKASVEAVRGRAAREVWLRRAAPFQAQPKQTAAAPASTSPTANNKTAVTALPVPIKPNHNDIDWERDPDRMLFISGKAFLKNGRLVSWRNGKAS